MTIDRVITGNQRILRTRPHLNENKYFTVLANQINLIVFTGPVAGNYTVAKFMPTILRRKILAKFAALCPRTFCWQTTLSNTRKIVTYPSNEIHC